MKAFSNLSRFWILLFFVVWGISAEEENSSVQIVRTSTAEMVSIDEIVKETSKFNVIVFGEEHDNDDLHRFYLALFKRLSEVESLSLSLEMLEKDEQYIVNEFLEGRISEVSFLSSITQWKNFKSDYFPLVSTAKEKKCNVIAANPPRRYVNLISRKGLAAYREFTDQAIQYLPPAYSLEKYLTEDYKQRLTELFGQGHGGGHGGNQYLILAQATWDQGMAEAISREFYKTGKKVVHLNGRFHSDRRGGVVHRLQEMGLSVLVLSGFVKDREESRDFAKIADFVILTNGR
ncbi:ChaN family lipoprotein [Leptospira sp. 2 VSF19]|uniref:ChaN family lipoprotein n=1 Tax=Leptospira soteropolitanensis TaxID=2950025 RepID=A0AAW5VSJ7_9LEPT|nr:ChaN family lipoprotein [Leptospira soteropolitanensis]MCW7494307.1 ChaN family lipoprotein [Leptospira soteropolitanensis]MCW7501984.1 ChaN family lipoprotein [Leptospira soteropolitanensis]MCW7524153.1 ChaN family lipoprotein [Leptospira soteropolitanensis]MCW7528018.1 ChaN family lipoprotein [Leptospira soteropolitanensis]MCW7531872.1 ChaN family lipoprotein [Leptospira soteropolitanensis]